MSGARTATPGFRAGFIAIVGMPNVGKSTLLNLLLGQKIAIISPRPQTTRNRILGVKNLEATKRRGPAQLVLLDTPGIHRPRGRGRTGLNQYMVDQALATLADVDAVLVLVEAPGPEDVPKGAPRPYVIGKEHRTLLDALAEAKKPAVLAVNKIDRMRRKDLILPVLNAWATAREWKALVPISALKGEGVERIIDELYALLPESEAPFPEEMITDRAERWLAGEMVREQVFLLTRQEVPYSVAITVDEFRERKKAGHPEVTISATIHVEKEAQKRILVGGGGRMVREIGSRARHEIGQLLDCPVHLSLFVRVDEGWSQDPQALRELGYE